MKCPGCDRELTASEVVSKTKTETVVNCIACGKTFPIKTPEKQSEEKP